MLKEIENITLIRRPPKDARRKGSEPVRPRLRTGSKPETIAIVQQWSRHRNSQISGGVWFIANAVRHHNCRVASCGWIDFSKNIVPYDDGRRRLGETHEFQSRGRTHLISHR